MKSWVVHYRNKFPGSKVQSTEDSLDVFSLDGEHLVAVRKDGGGQWRDVSEEMGCLYRHDLAPIHKDARVHKLQKDGKIGLDELAQERKQKSKSWKTGHEIESQAVYDARKAREKAPQESKKQKAA
jgi:hypothetical protein